MSKETAKTVVDKTTIKNEKTAPKSEPKSEPKKQAQEQTQEQAEEQKRQRKIREVVDYESERYGTSAFIQAVKERVEKDFDGITNNLINSIVHQVFWTIDDILASEGEVAIAGFGKFWTVNKPARIRRNVATGKRVLVNPESSVRFHSSFAYVWDSTEMSDEVKEFLKEFPDGKEPGDVIYKIPGKNGKHKKVFENEDDSGDDNEEDFDSTEDEGNEKVEE